MEPCKCVPEVEGAAFYIFYDPPPHHHSRREGRIYEALELSVIGGFGQIYAQGLADV